MKRIYLAGAYSADNVIGVLKNIGRGEFYAAQIFKKGYYPFCPWSDRIFVQLNFEVDFNVEMFYRYSMAYLEVCELMFLVPGWEESKGTLKEIERAKELGIRIITDLEDL